MDEPLLITAIMQHARRLFRDTEIVSITADAPLHRYTYGECFERVARLANALAKLGIRRGDRIGTLAWNDYRHLESYYAISCAGAVLHTVNPRLFDDQLRYIINHAGDRWLFVDPAFAALVERLRPQLGAVEGVVFLTDREHMPASAYPRVACYEELLADEPGSYDWPALEETTASAMCYTSGTTGHPKGVLYNHRSTVLHAYAAALPDAVNLSFRDTVMPVVPMFHANAWGLAYASVMVGAKLVFPGPRMGDGETLHGLIDGEGVTVTAGVPTVWLNLLKYLRDSNKTVPSLQRVVCGGSACPLAVMKEFEENHGVWVLHAWGMTEMSPLGTVNAPAPLLDELPGPARDEMRSLQGRPIFGVRMKIVGDDGRELSWDGTAFGSLKVHGPWVCSDYYQLGRPSEAHAEAGWFETGDVCSIGPDGNLRITDRTKDVIKSGGEWISSIDLENVAVEHPGVTEAAVIGVEHPRWGERPLMVVVRNENLPVDEESLRAFLADKVAKWWLPDAVVFVDEIPHTATGKINKLALRKQFADYVLPSAPT